MLVQNTSKITHLQPQELQHKGLMFCGAMAIKEFSTINNDFFLTIIITVFCEITGEGREVFPNLTSCCQGQLREQ